MDDIKLPKEIVDEQATENTNGAEDQLARLKHSAASRGSLAMLRRSVTDVESEDTGTREGAIRGLLDNSTLRKAAGGPETLKSAVKTWEILAKHPDWEATIMESIDRYPVRMPDGSSRAIPIELVLAVIRAESGGNNPGPANRLFVTKKREKIGSSAVGPMGTMAGHRSAQDFFRQRIAEGALVSNGQEYISLAQYDALPRKGKRQLIISAIAQSPEYGISEGIYHLRDKIESYNSTHRKHPLDPTNPNDAAKIYLCFNSGEGGAVRIERYVNNPTRANRAALPEFAKWKKTTNPHESIPHARYQLAQRVGRVTRACMLINSQQNQNVLAAILPPKNKQPSDLIDDRKKLPEEDKKIETPRGYISSLKPYVDERGQNKVDVVVASGEGSRTITVDFNNAPSSIKAFLSNARYDFQQRQWVLKEGSSKIEFNG